jgi:hypothetical protein
VQKPRAATEAGPRNGPAGGGAPARAFDLYGNGRAGKQWVTRSQAVPRVTSAVCAGPPSRMKVAVTVVPGA